MPATVEITLLLPDLSPVGKPIVARFDTAHLCSDAGLLVLREVENRLGIAPPQQIGQPVGRRHELAFAFSTAISDCA